MIKSKSEARPPMGVVTLVVLAAIAVAFGWSQLRTTPTPGEIAGMAATIKSHRSDLPTFPPPTRPPMGKSGSQPPDRR